MFQYFQKNKILLNKKIKKENSLYATHKLTLLRIKKIPAQLKLIKMKKFTMENKI